MAEIFKVDFPPLQYEEEEEYTEQIDGLEGLLIPNPGIDEFVERSLAMAATCEGKNALRSAAEIYEHVLKISPNNRTCYHRLGEIYLTASRPQKALRYFQEGLKLHPNEPIYYISLGKAYHELKRYETAMNCYRKAAPLMQSAIGEYSETLIRSMQSSLQVLMARTMAQTGTQGMETAVAMFSSMIRQNEDDVEVLYEFGICLRELKHVGDALRVFLKLLILQPGASEVRRQMGLLLEGCDAISVLQKEVSAALQSAEAVAFLASIIKEHGAVQNAIALYQKVHRVWREHCMTAVLIQTVQALNMSPSTSAYALALAHHLEVDAQYENALRVCVDVMKRHSASSLPHHSTARTRNGNDSTTSVKKLISIILHSNSNDSDKRATKRKGKERTGNCSGDVDALVKSILANFSRKDYFTSSTTNRLAIEECLWRDERTGQNPEDTPPQLNTLDSKQLDLLAIVFTVVKLEAIPPLMAAMEPIRFERMLHTTNIRNEHAYYCNIGQLLPLLSLPLPRHKPIFVIGDSHCLSAAWNTITDATSSRRLLVPLLVTGLKTWHLRPNASFFPKKNFFAQVSRLPRGAECIFLFGEIDCREGLLISVEKCRYDSIEEGADVAISHYLNVLNKLQERRSLTCYVHPIPPVLNETRHIVKIYNQRLGDKVKSHPKLRWLEFFDDLLAMEGTALKSCYELDGTHMHPKYLQLLQKALKCAD